ncbi:SEC10/PgrA surface exclusion domain-containing protein [Apilactobacillus sp. TMW 2.2459]|uniref:SEC10/PgrA surface exclusion domain-containing protein n=1 Tax=Apilactobacillus xinyiensis TaxID=2841032 RepID=UPI001C7DA75E|nr:SEC10/PgrA surface exclusion domain-containing protein [Apilactobacillus xinyiensis]MCL0312260.1 SEC10/PgrA surface exclusion domain-containing protein [Apilactobacillus xinyiensis]
MHLNNTIILSGIASLVMLCSPMVSNIQTINVNAKHIKSQHKVTKHAKKQVKLPDGVLRYHPENSFKYASSNLSSENATDEVNIPTGYPFKFDNGKIDMPDNFNTKFIKESYQINKFHPKTSDVNEKVNTRSLTQSQQDEITQYAANLINSARHKISNNNAYTADLTLDDNTTKFTNDIVKKYNEDHWKSAYTDDVKGINDVTRNYGMFLCPYCLKNNIQNYDQVIHSKLKNVDSMAHVKEAVYGAVCTMLFNDDEYSWGRTDKLLSADFLNESNEGLGVGIDNMSKLHFVIVPHSYSKEYNNGEDN